MMHSTELGLADSGLMITPSLASRTIFRQLRAPVILVGDPKGITGGLTVGKNITVFFDDEPVRRQDRLYLLDGVGLSGSDAIVSNEDCANLLDGSTAIKPLSKVADYWGTRIKNPCTAFVVDIAAQKVICLPDPLGGALVFRYRSNDVQIISSDIVSLTTLVTALGLPLEKSVGFQLERLMFGNGGLNPASYESIERLDLFEYWLIDQDGATRENYPSSDDEVSYIDAVGLIRDEFIESVVAVSKLPTDRRIAHITGGFDSRLVLAAAISAGCAKEFLYFCSGPAGSTDRKIADGLSQTFHLRRSAGGGLAASPLAHVHEQLLAPLYHSGGITASGPNGGESASNVVVVGGGYGGLLRSTFSTRFRDLEPEEVNPTSLMNSLAPRPAGTTQIYLDKTTSTLGQRLYNEWEKLHNQGRDHDFIGDALYLSVRNRYHFGQNSTLWSRVGRRFDPLYSVTAVRAAASLPLYSRQTNVLGFDVMKSFNVDLEKYPFDSNRYSDAYKSLRRVPDQRPMIETGTLEFDSSHSIAYGGKVSLPEALSALAVKSPTLSSADRKAVIEKANKIGLNYWHIATLEAAQKSLRVGLNEFGLSELEGYIDTKYAWHLAKERLRRRTEIRDVYAMYGLIAWLGVS